MNILPVSVSVVTKAVERRLQLDERLADVNIERSAEINEIPSRCPWVGIYRAECAFPHRALGTGIAGWRGQRVNVAILAQDSDPKAGDACEDRVNELVDKVLSALLSDTTLGGAVQALDEVTVRVELQPEQFSDKMTEMQSWRDRIHREIMTVAQIGVKVELVAPQTIDRSEGKAVRVIDKRAAK